ncbi:MAG: zinc-ribbon domain-containing protein [Planctomycetia bacterium]|nr:zinc-ribbon domain-containing protein [Planctomycetia bacterium]
MPVVACPKCPTQLKIPDGASGNVKCPKCGTIFPVSAKAPAFEVVDDAPAPSQKPAPKPAPQPAASTTSTATKPAPKQAQAEDFDFEVVDEKPKKRVVARSDDDDEEDEKPRKKRRDDDDDDDDDRPRSKKKRRDDDDEEDRPRKKKKKKRVYEDDDEDWEPRSSRGGRGFSKGKIGSQLLAISFWLNLGAYGLLAIYALIAWIMIIAATSSSPSSSSRGSSGGGGDGSFMDVVVILPGLAGLGGWIVGTIGCAIAIAGPARARGMAITATVLSGVHLLLTIITFSNMQEGLGAVSFIPGLRKIAWIAMASTLPALDMFLPMLFYSSKEIEGDYVIALLAGVCEVMRLIFALLTLKALATAAKDYEAAEKSHFGVMTTSFIAGGVMLGFLLIFILVYESAKSGSMGGKTALHLGVVTVLLMYLAYTAMMFVPALSAMMTKDACDRRT